MPQHLVAVIVPVLTIYNDGIVIAQQQLTVLLEVLAELVEVQEVLVELVA